MMGICYPKRCPPNSFMNENNECIMLPCNLSFYQFCYYGLAYIICPPGTYIVGNLCIDIECKCKDG
jgi:hypothetical protein